MLKHTVKLFRRTASILLVAYMLGISNIILEENRMINDSRKNVEQEEVQNKDDKL